MSTPGKGGYIQTVEDVYKTSYLVNERIKIKNTCEFAPLNGAYSIMVYGTVTVTITNPSNSTREITYSGSQEGNEYLTFDLSGVYIIKYKGTNAGKNYAHEPYMFADYSFTYYITAVRNYLPLKKWTITDVINRTLDLAEPLRKGEKARFYLNEEQAEQFNKILAPEFSFTQQTLRECLQEIGAFVHGEPRLIPKNVRGIWKYEVTYDMYASNDSSKIKYTRATKKSAQLAIENYASYLDSTVENLINQLDKYQGVIVEPYQGGAKAVRTESMYVRIEDANMLIPTQYPIYTVDKLEYVYEKNGVIKTVDITPYLFEQSIYNTQLSSYGEQYPYSKVYALYYAQGSKNIEGLNFKVPAASSIGGAYKDYAIVNIIRQATGDDSLLKTDEDKFIYPRLSFRVTYTPFYSARVAQTKVNYKDFRRPAALIYNQQANVIESRYYGENLKGAIARLGNIEYSLTYYLKKLAQIPKAGQKYNNDYYISVVLTEILPTCIKCTIGLSKDYNRLSQYIGVSSAKRYSEISQNQAVKRNVLYREYIVVGSKMTPDKNALAGPGMILMVATTFKPLRKDDGTIFPLGPITNVCAWGESYKGDTINPVNLPVITSAFGNSISFSWEYADNYSAGAVSQFQNNDKVKGYFQNSYMYTDYYGRMYYYNFDLQLEGPQLTTDNLEEISHDLPKGEKPESSSGYVSTVGKSPYILRKDNREALQVNYQIDFVSNIDTLIIGSALASYCPAVRGVSGDPGCKLYVFPNELNKFTDHVEAFENVDLSELPTADIDTLITTDGYLEITAGNFPSDGKAWAIVTAQTSETKEVEDEQGNKTTQTIYRGGDLLIGQNIEVKAGQAFTPIYFTVRKEIFDKSVWKGRR